jgi:hypothetical protein
MEAVSAAPMAGSWTHDGQRAVAVTRASAII